MLTTKPAAVQEILSSAVKALSPTLGRKEARLEVELLLAHVLGYSRAMLLARSSDVMQPALVESFQACLVRRLEHEPLAYILGHQQFYGLDFIVDRRVLIPRHETEMLVKLALECAGRIRSPVIVDVGTGSGVIALTLAHCLPNASIIATDISDDALAVATLNAKRLDLEKRVVFRKGDLLEDYMDPFDVVVSNLPYIPNARCEKLAHEIREFEPRIALDGGVDGLGLVRRLLAQVLSFANRGAVVLLEISEEQGASGTETALQALPGASVQVHPDLEGLDRVLEIKLDADLRKCELN